GRSEASSSERANVFRDVSWRCFLGSNDAVERPGGDVDHVKLSLVAFRERGNVQVRIDEFSRLCTLLAVGCDGPDPARTEIAKQVEPLEVGNVASAIDVPAGDGVAQVVGILGNGMDIVRRAAGRRVEAVRALALAPSVVFAHLHAVDFLPAALPDITNPEITRLPIEAEAPGVTEAPCKNLGAIGGSRALRAFRISGKRVLGRYSVRWGTVHIDSRDGGEQVGRILAVVLRISAASAVAEACVQETIRAEREVTSVVVAGELRHDQENLLRGLVEGTGRRVHSETRYDRLGTGNLARV